MASWPLSRRFSLLQKNVLDTRRWDSREELRLAIVTWIETTCNRTGSSTSVGCLRLGDEPRDFGVCIQLTGDDRSAGLTDFEAPLRSAPQSTETVTPWTTPAKKCPVAITP